MLTQLTTRQTALVLGISEASLKRWCDRGVLPAARTAGGHRRLPVPAVVEYVRNHGLPLARPEILGLPEAAGRGAAVVERVRDELRSALLAGQDETFRRLAFDPWLAGRPIHEVLERGVVPAFADLGRDVLHGSAEIYQERRAVEICLRFLHDVRRLLRTPADNAPLAIGGTTEGDPYVLPAAMIDLVLREAGWRTQSLGSGSPLQSLAAAIEDERPTWFWLSVSSATDRAGLAAGWARVREAAAHTGCRTVVGGRGIDADLQRTLAPDLCPASLGELHQRAVERAHGSLG